MKLKSVVIACVLCAATAATAEPYSVGSWTNDIAFLIDRSALRRSGSIVTGDTQVIFRQTRPDGVDTGLIRYEWDCGAERYRVMYQAVYDVKSNMTRSELGDKQWVAPPAGTVGKDLIKAVCSSSADPALDLKTREIPSVGETNAAARAFLAAHPKP